MAIADVVECRVVGQRVSDRLKEAIAGKRGPELVDAIIAELSALEAKIEKLQAKIAGLEVYSKFVELSGRLGMIDVPLNMIAPHRLSVSAVEYLPAKENFYDLEYSASGAPYRWTGPERSFGFTFVVDRSAPLALELVVYGFVDESRQLPLMLKVDGYDVRLRRVPKSGEGYTFSATLPARSEPRALPTELVFYVMETMSPSSSDERLLGVAFHEMRIHPAVTSAIAPRPEGEPALADEPAG